MPRKKKHKINRRAPEQIYIGVFESAQAAARARDKLAKELHGEFARLNFPEEQHD